MEAYKARMYITVIGNVADDCENTFCRKAKTLQMELLDPATDIHERLEWIDGDPADAFEEYLRRRAQRGIRPPQSASTY